MKRVTASEARVHFGELLRAVGERDEIVELVFTRPSSRA